MDYRSIIEIIGAVASLFAIFGGLYVAKRFVHHIWRRNGKFLNEYTRHSFFYPMAFAKQILRKNVFKPLGDSQFIDYSSALEKDYYSHDVATVRVKIGKSVSELQLPYKEIIDYIKHPDTVTEIAGGRIDSRFDLGERYTALTQDNFDEFLKSRPNTVDGPALRMQ